jgi:hypothetical protein
MKTFNSLSLENFQIEKLKEKIKLLIKKFQDERQHFIDFIIWFKDDFSVFFKKITGHCSKDVVMIVSLFFQ